MRALFSFDEAMTPALFSWAYRLVAAFILVLALFAAAAAFTTLNTVNFFLAAFNALGVLGAALAAILLLRLIGEIWMTQLRIQDRLNLILEQGRDRRGA
ncbi:MAG: DUF4282 domain-containing protein [Hydrogenophilaceae bacterium]|jgi:hypothetical protein|nr:DUF4282 domain-containing protein [Hydrogenophilaceae bacterium]